MDARVVSPEDLSIEALGLLMPDRAVRSYVALLSTQADALAWARSGAVEGSIVVADYQASPRGRGGVEWSVRPGASLSFSIILRPDLPPEREGWLYAVAASGLADALGDDVVIGWPDEVRRDDEIVGTVGVHAELGLARIDWAVVSVLVRDTPLPRGPLLRRVVEATEDRYRADEDVLLADYLLRCVTIGMRVRARMIPVGPAGVQISGTAVRLVGDGALTIQTDRGNHVSVRPQHLGLLDVHDGPGAEWDDPARESGAQDGSEDEVHPGESESSSSD